MVTRNTIGRRRLARGLTYGYASAGVVLLAVLALRAPGLEAWLWLALTCLVMLAFSLRSALVYVHRKRPSELNWWLRPTQGAENEFSAMWLAYALIFGAAPLLFVFI